MAHDETDTAGPFDPTEAQSWEHPSVVVGIGVCARSLISLERLILDIPLEVRGAYLVAVRQQEGLNVGAVVEALKRQGRMPVTIAADGEPLVPNHIYVGGSEDVISLEDGHVRTRTASEPVGHRGTVDTMLISVAEHAHERAVIVILKGLGEDGTAAVAATKKFGGLAIVEIGTDDDDIRGAKPGPDMADLRLPVQDIAGQIAIYASSA